MPMMDAVAFVTAGDVEILAARRSAAHENGVEALIEQALMLSTGEL